MTMRLAFPLTPELAERTDRILEALSTDETPRAHADALVALVLELTELGLRTYFLLPVERAGVGLAGRSAARLGVGTAVKSIPLFVRKVIRGMNDDQLRAIAGIMEEMIVRPSAPSPE